MIRSKWSIQKISRSKWSISKKRFIFRYFLIAITLNDVFLRFIRPGMNLIEPKGIVFFLKKPLLVKATFLPTVKCNVTLTNQYHNNRYVKYYSFKKKYPRYTTVTVIFTNKLTIMGTRLSLYLC